MISEEALVPEQYFDYKDRDNNWLVALVVARVKQEIKIRMEGYNSNSDQIITISHAQTYIKNNRIAAFRSYVRGLSGHRRRYFIRQHWKFSKEIHQQRLLKLIDFISNPKKLNPLQLTQYLRGEHYFYIDYLMSLTFKQKEQIVKVYQYFDKHLSICKQYLNMINQIGLSKFLTEKNVEMGEDQKWKAAYYQSYYQVFDGLYIIGGFDERCKVNLKTNQKLFRETFNVDNHHVFHEIKIRQSGIIQKFIKLINNCHDYSFKPSQDQAKLPHPFLICLVKLFLTFQKRMRRQSAGLMQQIYNKTFQVVKTNLQIAQSTSNIQHLERQLDRQYQQFFTLLRTLFLEHKQQISINKWIDASQLSHCLMMVKSDKLERKLKGLNRYKEYGVKFIKENQEDSKKEFIEYIQSARLIQIFLQSNNNIQFYKKSLEVIFTFAKFEIVDIKGIIYLWRNSLTMQVQFLKHLYQNIVELFPFLKPQSLEELIEQLQSFYDSDNLQKYSNLNLEFYLQLIVSMIRYNSKEKLQVFEKGISRLIRKGYDMLDYVKKIEFSQSCYMLLKTYAKIVAYSCQSQTINFLFDNIRQQQQHFQLNMHILVEIYINSYENGRKIYIPPSFFKDLVTEIHIKELPPDETSLIIRLINELIIISKDLDSTFEIPREQFKEMWVVFKNKPEHIRSIFYEWIVHIKRSESHHDYILIVNPIFNPSFKEFIIEHIIKDEQILDYQSLSKREMQILIELIISNNIHNEKLEKKSYQSSIRTVYKLRQVELNYESILWSIFEKCRNTEALPVLNNFLTSVHLFFSDKMAHNLRKGRIDDLMSKLATSILEYKQPHDKILLVQHSLILLKKIVELVKEQKKVTAKEKVSTTNIKIHINIDGKNVPFQVNYQDTIKNIKYSISQKFKIKLSNFKLANIRGQELGFQFRDFPIYAMSDKYFKVIEIAEEEETLTKFIFGFMDEQVEMKVIQMMENQILCREAEELLDQMPLKSQKSCILEKILKILYKFEPQDNRNSIKFCHSLLIKLVLKNMTEQSFVKQYIESMAFKSLLEQLQRPLNSKVQVQLINKILSLLLKLIKNGYSIPLNYNVPSLCMALLVKTSSQQMNQNQIFLSKDKQSFLNIFQNCFYVCEDLLNQATILNFFVSHDLFTQLMQNLYLNPNNQKLQQFATQRLYRHVQSSNISDQSLPQISIKLLITCESIYCRINELSINPTSFALSKAILQFYSFYSKIIRKIDKKVIFQLLVKRKENALPSMWQFIMSNLFMFKVNRNIMNLNKNNKYLFTGNMYLVKSFITVFPSIVNQDIVSFILEDCLGFKINCNYEPLCKYFLAKKSAFQILDQIIKNNQDTAVLNSIIGVISPNHRIKVWRTVNNWSVAVKSQTKQQFRGLNNPGCMCYMNSLMQQLFMIDQFKLAVSNLKINERLQLRQNQGSPQEESQQQLHIIKELKDLMFKLQYSQQNSLNPVPFARTFKTIDKRPLIKINQQMDIDQFASLFFQKLQKGLKTMSSANFVKELFSGTYSRQVISKQCEHQSEKQQQFLSMSLQVKNNLNILQSFKSLVKIETLDGQNKYFCQKCNKKVKAEMLQSIKKLPPYLILCLKRFEYNYEAEVKIKINDFCEFYPEINLKEYSKQEINKRILSKDDIENLMKNQTDEYEDDYFVYKLKGVVVHLGQADSGHYYSFIEARKNQWFQFNDEDVMPFDVKKLGAEAFGNRENYNQQKIRNAYLLIYQRESKKHHQAIVQSPAIDENKLIIDSIKKSNRQKYKFELMFSAKYEQLHQSLCKNFQKIQQLQKQKINVQSVIQDQKLQKSEQSFSSRWTQFYLSYFFLIRIRKQTGQHFYQAAKQIQGLIKSQLILDNSLNIFLTTAFIEEFIIYNPVKDKAKVIRRLLQLSVIQKIEKVSLKIVKREEQIQNNEYVQQYKQTFSFVTKIFKILRTLLNYYKFNAELTIFVTNLLQYLNAKNQKILLNHILSEVEIEKTYIALIIEHLNGGKDQNQKKSLMMLKNIRKQMPLSYFPEVDIAGKFESQGCQYQTWRLLYTICSILKIKQKTEELVSSSEYQVSDKHLSNYFTFVEVLTLKNYLNIIYQNNSMKGAYYIVKFFSQLNRIENLLDYCERGLKDMQSYKFRAFMLVIHCILDLDQLAELGQRHQQRVIKLLNAGLNSNSTYFFESDMITQWINYFANNYPQFASALLNSKGTIDSMTSWLGKMISNMPEIIKKNKTSQQRSLNRYFGIVVSTETKQYINCYISIRKNLQALKNGTHTVKNKIKIVVKQFEVGQRIEFCQIGSYNWKKGKVVENNYGNLSILINQKRAQKINICEDSERISYIVKESAGQETVEQSSDSNMSYSSQSYSKDRDESDNGQAE